MDMDEAESRQCIVAKLRSGALPPWAGHPLGGWRAASAVCAGCDLAILPECLDLEVDAGRGVFHFHPECAAIWMDESCRPRPAVPADARSIRGA